MPDEAGSTLRVVIAIDRGARQVEEHAHSLPVGALLGDALHAVGMSAAEDAGIWGRIKPADTPLRDGDRVEVYRPLRVDPKTARRERFKTQGARATGLFARKD